MGAWHWSQASPVTMGMVLFLATLGQHCTKQAVQGRIIITEKQTV